MRTTLIRTFPSVAILVAVYGMTAIVSAQTRTIRVVTYNIQDDISGNTTPLPGLISPSSGGSVTNGGVLEGIGEEILGTDLAQPIDILTLQETTSNPVTVQPIVDGLNAFYSSRSIPAGYAMSPYQATQSGGNANGNGPNALVYNTNTLQLIASVGVGTPGGASNGEYRQVVRYEFAPAGVTPTPANEFYVYVSHCKSGTTSGDQTDRNGEATIIRADAATLPSGARILYTGDFNASSSSEAMYQTLVAAGANQAFDTLNPSGVTGISWGSSTMVTSVLAALSESAPNLRFRDDYQMMTSNTFYGIAGGLAYIPGTYHVFGNNGTTPYNGTVNSGANTSLNSDLNTNGIGITASQLYQYLTTASDHLPVVADYTIPVPAAISPQSVQTIFVIPMENMNWSSIEGNGSAPYINGTLLPIASRAEQYYNPPGLHPSLPNYLWLEAGTNFNVTSDVVPPSGTQTSTNHLVTLLKNAGISWRSYDEDICACLCPLANTNNYVPRHNPFVYFDDVTDTNNANSANCLASIRTFANLSADLQSNTVARYNWVVPNLCDDMHNSCSPLNNQVLQGDTWLANNLPAILNSQAYSNNGAIFIVWDEGAGSSDGPIGMIVLSPLAKGGGYTNTIHYTHSSALLMWQEIFNVGPMLGGAANATDLSDLFVFGAQLALSPASGLTSSGNVGGPFSPSSQVYTLSNTGGVAMVWTVSNTSNWLTLSATNGTLAAGDSTNITVSINATANSLAGGGYSDTVSFNTSNGSGNTTRPVSLTVSTATALLSVTPASGLGSAGPPGGPFSPVSQTYTLSNSGGTTLNWTANNTASWLTLSATSGTLAPSSSTAVIASINANANSLANGNYSDTIGFTNTTNGAGNTTRSVSLNINSFGFFDDFSAFASGNLVGQHSWTQVGAASTLPLQVTGGQVVLPAGQTADNQDAYKNFTQTNGAVFYGITVTVTNPSTVASPSYFTGLYTSNNAGGFANYRLTTKAGDAAKTNFVFGVRITGETGDPYTFGTAALSTGAQYRVIIQAPAGGTTMSVYVNPTSSNLGSQTAYVSNPIGSGTAPTSIGSFVISQFGSVSGVGATAAARFGKACVATDFASVYNFLTGVVPPPVANFSGTPTSGTEPLFVTFADTSTGTITNRFWDFGDSSTTNITTNTITHTYPAGTYTVTLVASGPGGVSTNVQANYITVLTGFQAWQIQYFGSTGNPAADPNADPDGDGLNNMAEFLAGTDPTNNTSALRITSVMPTNNDVVIAWTYGSGKTNALQEAAGAADGSYQTNDFTDIFTVTNTLGTATNYLDVGAATNFPSRYYRIRLVP